jgi:lysophospholipase L1-like esterase
MRVYVIGDSISIQYGPHLARFLGGIADYSRKEGEEEALLNLDQPQGANGGDSSMVLDFLRAKARSGWLDVDLFLLNCGLHDIKTDPATGARQVPVEQYTANLREVVRLVASMGPRPRLVWIRTTPCDEAVHNCRNVGFHRFAADCAAYNRAADEVMAAAGVPAIDLHAFTLSLGPELYCDHVHFLEPVREKQAAFIAGWLAACRSTQGQT